MSKADDQLQNSWITSREARAFKSFLDELRAQGRSERTCEEYASDWRNYSRWFYETNGERFQVGKITALDVKDFKRHCQAVPHAGATINRRLVFLKSYCRFAVDRNLLSGDTLRAIERVPLIKRETLAPRSLTRLQIRKYLREVERRAPVRDQALIKLLLYTGIRAGEIARLEMADLQVSPRKGILTVRSIVAKRAKERDVPIPLEARQALADYLSQRKSKSSYVFAGQRGSLTVDGVAWIVKKYGRLASVEITPHLLRHTFAYSYLENNQNDLVGLAKILGHDSVETTQIYTQKRLADLESAVENVKFY
jgi:site-specific recombinase XerD